MNGTSRIGAVVALLALIDASGAAAKTTNGIHVESQGFCVRIADSGRCGEVVLPDTRIDLSRLAKRPDGTRVIYFFSNQTAGSGAIFVHVLEAEDEDPHVDYVLPDKQAQNSALGQSLKSLVKKLMPEGEVTLTSFKAAASQTPSLVISSMPVRGPGALHASVVDLKGNLIPSGNRISITAFLTPH